MGLQRKRLVARLAFFALFVLAPPLDILRLDLHLGHFILFGQDWTLGLDAFVEGRAGTGSAALNLTLRGLLPIALVAGGGIWVAWRYGRLYCGWLCPHFSVVELINGLMRRAGGKPTLWERTALPERLPDGRVIRPDARYWALVIPAVLGFAFLWAVVLLTYLLPPAEIYGNLWAGSLTRNQAVFLTAATVVFALEFLLARHLFCRFGCAVGLFQSLAWMANRRALVVGFDRTRVHACADCDAACDHACPMRLKPRSIKRLMFACTQCARCITACEQVQSNNPEGSLLQWVSGDCALDVSDRDFGRRRPPPAGCFKPKGKGPGAAASQDAPAQHCTPGCSCMGGR
ncbi:MAG: 4Fe-4S binding protein [Gammaproteobacteria bacterium]